MNSVAAPPGARNPYGGAFTMEETPLVTERQAQRNLDLASSRKWIVINPNVMCPFQTDAAMVNSCRQDFAFRFFRSP